MRDLTALDQFRHHDPQWAGDSTCGAFMIPSPTDRKPIVVLASSDLGWDHVSASRATRCPNWPEMVYIARLFFADDEVAFQLHLPEAQWVSNHPYCLHWWRPQNQTIPLPDSLLVGIKELGELSRETVAKHSAEMYRLAAEKLGL